MNEAALRARSLTLADGQVVVPIEDVLDLAATPSGGPRPTPHDMKSGCQHTGLVLNVCDDCNYVLGWAATPSGGPLDVAWVKAEKALPKGWRLRVTRADEDYATWQASACSPAFFDGENDNDAEVAVGEARTPTAALHALAARLTKDAG